MIEDEQISIMRFLKVEEKSSRFLRRSQSWMVVFRRQRRLNSRQEAAANIQIEDHIVFGLNVWSP